jgi:hypothetical protein
MQAMNPSFIRPSQEITKYFAADAIEEANKDFSQLFSLMFSESRRIAVDECDGAENFQIDRSSWQRAKWYVLTRSTRNRRNARAISLLGLGIILTSAFFGYSLAIVATKPWYAVCSGILTTVAFFIKDSLERER